MLIIVGIVFILAGALMLFNPNAIFEITQGWKTYSAAEPSALYAISTRIGGAVFIVIGIIGIVAFFLQ